MRNRLVNEYFKWLFDLVCEGRWPRSISYERLLVHLHNTEFVSLIPNDRNRAEDGIDLRYRFAVTKYNEEPAGLIVGALDGPCSVLEMMIALAIRCEVFMDDPSIGDRTGQWFWNMVVNLGLGSMTDNRYDRRLVDDALECFLNREYEPDGKGGLFRVRDYERDLRDVEIWKQLCWYLDSIT